MKRNLILFIAITLVLVSLVSAAPWSGWFSGKAIDNSLVGDVEPGQERTQVRNAGGEVIPIGAGQVTLLEEQIYETEMSSGEEFTIAVLIIENDLVGFQVNGATGEIRAGSSAVISGLQIEVVDVFDSWWKRNSVIVEFELEGNVLEPGQTILPTDDDDYDGFLNLEEGTDMILGIEGSNAVAISISFISATQVVLNIGGENTNSLSEGNSQVMGDVMWTVLVINYTSHDGEISGVYLGYNLVEEEEEGELSYVGILSMLNNAEPTGQFLLGLSSNNGEIIQSMSGDQFCGASKTCLFGYSVINFPNTPYFGSEGHSLIGCQTVFDLETIQEHNDWVDGSTFSLQYMCIDNPSEGNRIAGGWGCRECSSPGQCGPYSTCLSSGCCGGTSPSGLTNDQTN